jgi:hypothetical protein
VSRLFVLAAVVAACGGDKLPVSELQDPATCKECHPRHYDDWAGSMHAYASDDPVFLAMNARGQRDTAGALGTFCIQCHAPMAVALNLTTTGDNFDPTTLPPQARGITCYFCHDVASVREDHNNGLVLALDQTMRGGAKNPVDSPAHDSVYDKKMAGKTSNSQVCGSCHDIVTPAGVALERTYSEWQTTIFALNDPMKALPQTCGTCHMVSFDGPIADKPGLGVTSRPKGFHSHTFAAIDQAFTPFPADAPANSAQATAIQDILEPSVAIISAKPLSSAFAPGGICLDPPGKLTVRLDTFSLGHMFPSGAGQDRRAWVEVIATRMDGSVVLQSGVVPDGMDPSDIGDPVVDCVDPTNCSGFWDRTFKADNTPAHFFWDVASYQSHLLRPPVTTDPTSPAYDHSSTLTFNIGPTYNEIDRITARLRIRPLPLAMLAELAGSGDLSPTIAASLPTLDDSGATAVWTQATQGMGIGSKFTHCNPNPPL